MAENAYSTNYRETWIQKFERKPALLRYTVTTDTVRGDLGHVFLIAGSNGEATGRGANGKIPSDYADQTQVTVTLQESHKKIEKTRFNIFTGQANQREIMQVQGRHAINRKIDDVILTAMAAATVEATGVSIMDRGAAAKGRTLLANAEVDIDDGIFCAVTPNQWAILENDDQFVNADYVDVKPLQMGVPNPQSEAIRFRWWRNINWFQHTGLPGKGTSSATCYMWHRTAVGHCIDGDLVSTAIGYNEEDDYSFARHSVFHGAKILQNAGIVKFTVDDTQYS